MKTIGLIGGMSWESTVTYYEILNREIAKALGGFHSAKIMMYNVDFAELEGNMSRGNWDGNAKILSDAAKRLENAGADFIVIATNTMHKLVPQIEQNINIPVLHIADATANVIKRDGIRKVGLLGTKYTMTQDFIKDRLKSAGLEVILPDEKDIELVNSVIFNELCLGKVLDSSRGEYQRIISYMKDRGAEGVILGCTEIGMLIGEKDSVLPTYDTTVIHAKEAARRAIQTCEGYNIRPETPADYAEVENLVRESFWNVYRPGCTEHFVLKKLRNDPDFVPELDFVMEKDGKIIGQNVFVRAEISLDGGGKLPVMAMGPICIAPEFKRQGYGKILLDYSLEKAKEFGCKAVCFEGNIKFYGKSGFVMASTKGIRYHGVPEGETADFFLCKELESGYFDGITGVYATPKGYFVADEDPEEFAAYEATFPVREKLKLPGQIFEN